MILYFFLWLFVPKIDDLVVNPATKKISQKNLFGVISFFVGIVLSSAVVVIQLYRDKPVDTAPLAFFTINGLGLSAVKAWQGQKNRETATEEGQPLAEPGSSPPVPMPQPYNPNAPANQAGAN